MILVMGAMFATLPSLFDETSHFADPMLCFTGCFEGVHQTTAVYLFNVRKWAPYIRCKFRGGVPRLNIFLRSHKITEIRIVTFFRISSYVQHVINAFYEHDLIEYAWSAVSSLINMIGI
jgi:hypothetical protein